MKYIEIITNTGDIQYINNDMIIGICIDKDTKGIPYVIIDLVNGVEVLHKKFLSINSVDNIFIDKKVIEDLTK